MDSPALRCIVARLRHTVNHPRRDGEAGVDGAFANPPGLMPVPLIDRVFDRQTEQKSLTEVTEDSEEVPWRSSASSVPSVRALLFGE
jgi:hypothetical protein